MCQKLVSLQRKSPFSYVTITGKINYYRSQDQSLRLFDIETGIELIAPMEEMECDQLCRQDEYIVASCGQGQAFIVFKYNEEASELEEIDFIDLQGPENGSIMQQQQQESKGAFRMKGGHKVSNLQDE